MHGVGSDMGSLSVLAVDDDEVILSVLRYAFAALGLTHIETTQDARLALERCNGYSPPPDLVLCDLNMPHMDGLEFLRHLAARRYRGWVVLMSGFDKRVLRTGVSVAEAHQLNVLDALAKPIGKEDLRALLVELAAREKKRDRPPERPLTPHELHRGIWGDQLVVHFQPQVSLDTRRVVGAEALVRWQHPSRGIIGPDAFIPVAEEAGLIDELTAVVMGKAIEQAGRWHTRGRALKLAINLSTDNLKRLDLPEKVVALAERHGVQVNQLVFEVTETRVMSDITAALEVLTRLRLKGIELSIDDFGTSYSTMEQLQRAPFSELKIDRLFVKQAGHDATARAILESTIDLARKLDMTTVAEGVETREQWDMVARLGCDVGQGYLIARPMPAEPDFDVWLKHWRTGVHP